MVKGACSSLLHAQTIPRPSAEGYKIPMHGGIDITKPTLRKELEWSGINRGVGVHQVSRHANRNLVIGTECYCNNQTRRDPSYPNGNCPLLVSDRYIRRAPWEPVHNAVAKTSFEIVVSVQSYGCLSPSWRDVGTLTVTLLWSELADTATFPSPPMTGRTEDK